MSIRKTLTALLIAAPLAMPAQAQQAGIYDVTGVNLDGSTYTGLAQIRQLGLASFAIVWRIRNEIIEGVGFSSGRTVSVAYGLAQRPGIGIYTLNPDGSMDGEWTIIGAPANGRERLVLRGAPAPAVATPAPAAASPAPTVATPAPAVATPAPAVAPTPETPPVEAPAVTPAPG